MYCDVNCEVDELKFDGADRCGDHQNDDCGEMMYDCGDEKSDELRIE